MKTLFLKLINGISKNDIPKKHISFVDNLISKDFISIKYRQDSDILFLNSIYIVGTLDISKNNTGFIKPLGENKYKKDVIVEQEHLYKAVKGDIVLAKTYRQKGKIKAKIEIIIQNTFEYSLVYLHQTSSKNIQAREILSNDIVPICASQKSLKVLPSDCILKIKNSNLEIVEVLGVMSDANIDEKISLSLYNKKEIFSQQSENEAISFGKKVDKNMYPNRNDLTNLPFCTIDPSTAKDHDDAIYFDKDTNILYVAIADVSEYVNEFSSIDNDAKERGFSIYFPHKSIPMLPRNLSENICSLKENEDRLAFVCKIYLDNNCEVIKEEFIEAIINSKKKFSYEEVDILLENKNSNQNNILLQNLFILFDKTQIIRKKRLQNSMVFMGDELSFILDENMRLTNTIKNKQTPSHHLIEECMLLANKASAKKIGKYGIFRTHDNPDISKLEDLLATLHSIGIQASYNTNTYKMIFDIQQKANDIGLLEFVDKLLIQTQKQAKYTKENKGHFGLGFDMYSHFTSPIRRYSDLILHRIIKTIIYNDKKQHNYIMKEIDALCDSVSTLERESAKVQYDFEDRKFARFANENIGIQIEGIIIDTHKLPILKMTSPIYGARIFLETFSYDLSIFDKVQAQITRVDIFNANIYANMINLD
jgi:ribonuclease R